MKKYTRNRLNKPDLKKCKDCGNFGMPNRACKYWVNDLLTEWGCKHPEAIKKSEVEEDE